MTTRHIAGLLAATALLVGCSGDEDNTDNGPLITAGTYHEVMRVGDFADFSDESLTTSEWRCAQICDPSTMTRCA